mmetsp:Transcript_78220/g.252935  ORF Transcript_78220/g.252935 Transcript_78220/m.252935 type:complete len:80 (-) Transcript_78220:1379-1618(-)
MGHFALALPLREEVLELRRRLLGEAHLDTLNSMHDLGWCLVGVGERGPAGDARGRGRDRQEILDQLDCPPRTHDAGRAG